MSSIRKVLIANRGEIALRIIRGCRVRGIATVAVFSEADRLARHVLLAHEAVPLGPAPATQSYLCIEKLIAAARATGADAVHPGYGFLSERAEFARACEEAGLTFIGPTSEQIRLMGDKRAARAAMARAGVPVVPGSDRSLETPAAALEVAESLGYPVLLKAAAGGGGKGIREVEQPKDLPAAFERAAAEARKAFGSGELYLERRVRPARHIEVQVLGDGRGAVLQLGERDCSTQRRHQKLIEESPAPELAPELRVALHQAAVRGAAAIAYRGAGTLEFLVDVARGQFYFLEMNTRLQVEHPVTEMVTRRDLVGAQLAVAAGEGLPFAQEDIDSRGHAIEVRLNAEDPGRDFAPSAGTVRTLRLPGGCEVRVDTALTAGTEVGLHYDSLLAKVIVWGQTRAEAIERMAEALREFHLAGLATTAELARRVVTSEDFRRVRLHTTWLEEALASGRFAAGEDSPANLRRVAALAAVLHRHHQGGAAAPAPTNGVGRRVSAWVLRARAERTKDRAF